VKTVILMTGDDSVITNNKVINCTPTTVLRIAYARLYRSISEITNQWNHSVY